MPATAVYTRILDWLRAGYPDGIPPTDYLAVVGVLRRRLSDPEIDQIADQLAAQAAADVDPLTPEQIREMSVTRRCSLPARTTYDGSRRDWPPAAGRCRTTWTSTDRRLECSPRAASGTTTRCRRARRHPPSTETHRRGRWPTGVGARTCPATCDATLVRDAGRARERMAT